MTVTIRRQGKGHLLQCALLLPKPAEDVFGFFADATNLESITPPRLRFEILTPPHIEMRAGTLIDFRLRLHGFPLRWKSEITAWEPSRRFVDEQRRGPYRWWIHEHTFEERGEGALVKDHVQYGVPGGAIVNALLVAADLRRIFEYRCRKLHTIFPGI